MIDRCSLESSNFRWAAYGADGVSFLGALHAKVFNQTKSKSNANVFDKVSMHLIKGLQEKVGELQPVLRPPLVLPIIDHM